MNRSSEGFTLIEMLVVMGIIVLITFVALPSVTSYFEVSLNSATRDIATNIKEAYNAAMLSGRVHRVAYDLKEHSFWVESGPPDALLETKETKDKDLRRKRLSKASDDKAPSKFTIEKSITRKKLVLPRGVTFEDIISQAGTEPITEGMAYTHFFPHGVAEQTLIHIRDQSKHQASLVITPLLGQVDFYGRYVKQDEIFSK